MSRLPNQMEATAPTAMDTEFSPALVYRQSDTCQRGVESAILCIC